VWKAVGDFVLRVRISLAPVPLAADRRSNGNPDGVRRFLLAILVRLGQDDASTLLVIELEEVLAIRLLASCAQDEVNTTGGRPEAIIVWPARSVRGPTT